jgi:hypothetical protein
VFLVRIQAHKVVTVALVETQSLQMLIQEPGQVTVDNLELQDRQHREQLALDPLEFQDFHMPWAVAVVALVEHKISMVVQAAKQQEMLLEEAKEEVETTEFLTLATAAPLLAVLVVADKF